MTGTKRPEFSAAGYAPRVSEPVPYPPFCQHVACIEPSTFRGWCDEHKHEYVQPKKAPELRRRYNSYPVGERKPPMEFTEED